MNVTERIETLVKELNEASVAYYSNQDEIMSNYEWDAKLDELAKLEEETGYILPDSPTQNVSDSDENNNGEKEEHEYPALSLAKSKDINVLKKWAGDKDIWVSWKLDGLTLVLTYDNGKLSKLMTRGNGIVGTNISYMAQYIRNVPLTIKDKKHLVVRGEATISYSDFAIINDTIENEDEQYANPRNLASGTLSLDKSRVIEIQERCVTFTAFNLVHCDDEILSWGARMDYLDSLGFKTVERKPSKAFALQETINQFTLALQNGYDTPVDGLVVVYDDVVYASQGSITNHHATNAGIAFKWQDTKADTILDHIEWSCAANSISPVAVFDPVNLEGTTVSRASLCNISEMRRLGIGANRKTSLGIIKANMIIPKCIEANAHDTMFEIPDTCPVCGAKTEVHISGKNNTETLHCTNPDCAAKHIKQYARFVSKTGMDIDGLSAKTITKFINLGLISDFADIYLLSIPEDMLNEMEGFGKKSYDNLMVSIKKSKEKADFIHFVYALSIPMIGLDAAKKIINSIGSAEFENRLENGKSFEDIDGIGEERSISIMNWYSQQKNRTLYNKLRNILTLPEMKPFIANGKCKDLVFVITGSVEKFKNRNEFKAYVESEGGKVTGSVSEKTNYLVNNDSESSSSKNKKAKELGVPIITEEEFLSMF